MNVTGLELIPVWTTREMGKTCPSDPVKAVSYHVIVRIKTDSGMVGIGEMSDVDFATNKTFVGRLKHRLEPFLIGKDPFELTAIQMALSEVDWEHQVRCGIDVALHDLVARALDVPVYALLGGRVRKKARFSYPLAACRTESDVEANLERIRSRINQGHDCFRYYFGVDLDLDERLLNEVRRQWGDGVEINALDASGGFEVKDAILAINRLAPYGANVVESPVKGRHNAPVEEFLEVKDAVSIPIGEHITNYEIGARMARHEAVDVWNLGAGYAGITACLRLFATARQA